MAKYLRVTYVKSSIGNLQRHKDTIRALGFRKLGQTVEVADNPALRGMVKSVSHLVVVEEIERESESPATETASASSGGTK
ncbi:MAG: 50S ribosomal protein L30 [Anaerolineae bacterium]